MVIREACIENYSDLEEKLAKGIERVELCDNLAEGGTGATFGVAKYVTQLCHENGTVVMAMVRTRKGDFVYSDREIEAMCDDIELYREAGVDGVVFGCITSDGELDKEAILKLMDLSKGLDVTFHMAFDELNEEEKLPAIDWLSQNGVKRILTHGGEGSKAVEEVIPTWKKYIEYAKGKLIILPGGGVRSDNYEWIAKEIDATEVHGTKII